MTQKESLEQFGTIAFARDFMSATINFGKPIFHENTFAGYDRNVDQHSLCLVVWLSFVPEVYREDIKAMLERISPNWKGLVATSGTISFIVDEITKEVHKMINTGVLYRR